MKIQRERKLTLSLQVPRSQELLSENAGLGQARPKNEAEGGRNPTKDPPLSPGSPQGLEVVSYRELREKENKLTRLLTGRRTCVHSDVLLFPAMDAETCSSFPTDLNANINLKDFDGADQACPVDQQCYDTLTGLRELPFLEEDILKVFEINPNLKRKRKPRRLWYRRRSKRRVRFQPNKRNEEKGNENEPEAGKTRLCECIPSEEQLHKAKSSNDIRMQHVGDVPCNKCQHDYDVENKGSSQVIAVEEKANEAHDKPQSETIKEPCPNIEGEGKPCTLEESAEHVEAPQKHQERVKSHTCESCCKPALCNDPDPKEESEADDLTKACHCARSTDASKEEKSSEVRKSSNSDRRPRPNYFVAIPITNDQILDVIEDVQEHIVLKEAKLLRALIPAEKVHITILVANLRDEEEIKKAVSALMQSKVKVEDILQGKPLRLTFNGIGQFNNQVIYIKITECEQELLNKIAEAIVACFTAEGIDISGSKDFRPHLTFLKLSKAPSLRRKGFRKICSDLYKEYEDHFFGTEKFTRIDLCSMHKKNKQSGYYYCECSIFFDTIMPSESGEEKQDLEETDTDNVKSTNGHSEEPSKDEPNLPVIDSDFCVEKDSLKSLDVTGAVTIIKERETDEKANEVDVNNYDLFPAEPTLSVTLDEDAQCQLIQKK